MTRLVSCEEDPLALCGPLDETGEPVVDSDSEVSNPPKLCTPDERPVKVEKRSPTRLESPTPIPWSQRKSLIETARRFTLDRLWEDNAGTSVHPSGDDQQGLGQRGILSGGPGMTNEAEGMGAMAREAKSGVRQTRHVKQDWVQEAAEIPHLQNMNDCPQCVG